jgi:hypothetical protein
MSLITLKSRFDNQDEAFLFKCDFPQPIVIKPNSEIELLNFECRRSEGFVINENNNITRIKLGAFSDKKFAQRLVKIPHGNYSGKQLAEEFARQLNDTMVNSAYRFSALTSGAGNDSGWKGEFSLTGGNDNGPMITITNNQNLISEFLGSVTGSKGDWVFADVDEGTEFSPTTYLDTNVNVAPTTFAAGTNLTGKWSEFLPKNITSNNPMSFYQRRIMSNFGVYENGECNWILPAHAGEGIKTGGTLSLIADGNEGYVVGDQGLFTGGTGSGASYKVTTVDASGTITAFDITDAGAKYTIGDILSFEAGTEGTSATYTLAGSVTSPGAAGFYKTKVGISRYTTFEGADWLSDPNGAWGVNFADFMIDVEPNSVGDGQPKIRASWTKYSTIFEPPKPNWRTQTDSQPLANLNTYLTTYTLNDSLRIRMRRLTHNIDFYINHDTGGNLVFDDANEVLFASTGISGIGTPGHLGGTMSELQYPYIPFIYMSGGADLDNKIKFSGVMSNIEKGTIIAAQQYHNDIGRYEQNTSSGSAVTVSSQSLDALWDGVSSHDSLVGATNIGDAINLSVFLRMKFIEQEDLNTATPPGPIPAVLFTNGTTTFPNDCNSFLTLGEPQGFLLILNTDVSDPITHKLVEPNEEVDEAAYHIEIQELPVISYNGFSRDINKDIMVIPREQLQTGAISGALTWNSQYRIPVDLHNVDILRLNSMTVYIRDSDGKFSTGLDKPTQLTLKITEKENFEGSMRSAFKELSGRMGRMQGNQIDNIGKQNRLL